MHFISQIGSAEIPLRTRAFGTKLLLTAGCLEIPAFPATAELQSKLRKGRFYRGMIFIGFI